ncbi:MAG: siphovirus Gp157 family protein, partial [Candidatus Marinimicrobia bacterium]|nr:siphovirus Gp157 family protein [Candidatus Neomarinimicrobiota bacterium]
MPEGEEIREDLNKVFRAVQDKWNRLKQETQQRESRMEDDKAENIAKVLKELDGQSSTLANEIKRLQERKSTIETNSRNLKKYLQQSMESVGKR